MIFLRQNLFTYQTNWRQELFRLQMHATEYQPMLHYCMGMAFAMMHANTCAFGCFVICVCYLSFFLVYAMTLYIIVATILL